MHIIALAIWSRVHLENHGQYVGESYPLLSFCWHILESQMSKIIGLAQVGVGFKMDLGTTDAMIGQYRKWETDGVVRIRLRRIETTSTCPSPNKLRPKQPRRVNSCQWRWECQWHACQYSSSAFHRVYALEIIKNGWKSYKCIFVRRDRG